jgi:MYXO-CTERM domain-containing protein
VLLANLGPATSQPVSAPPKVAFSAPSDGAAVGLSFDVAVSASAAAGLSLTKVEISTGAQLFTLTSAPYTQTVTVAQPGSYTLTATAYDSGGNSTSATIQVNASSPTMPPPSSPPDMSPGPSMPAPSTPPGSPPGSPPSVPGDGTGKACSTALSCQSGLCVSGVCSERCDPAHPSCPAGWSCGGAGASDVCMPPSADAGCSTAPGAQPPAWPALLFALLLAAGRARLRRR